MVDRINPIVPGNPDIFPVPSVGLPHVGEQEREQRRRAREEEERDRRRAAAEQDEQPPADVDEDDGRPRIDVVA